MSKKVDSLADRCGLFQLRFPLFTPNWTPVTRSVLVPEFIPVVDAAARRRHYAGRILGDVYYGPQTAVADSFVSVAMPQCEEEFVELWPSAGDEVVEGELGKVRFRSDGDFLFGAFDLPTDAGGGTFAQSIADAYRQIAGCAVENACPHLLRVWNYFADIHGTIEGLDRYQLFCRARHGPLVAHCDEYGDGYPAATAIGCGAGAGNLYFLAARDAGRHQENPRQVSAYEYPLRYGPQSPSFARATLTPGSDPLLLISGTASIVGHESRHTNDPRAQFDEALRNVEQVIRATHLADGSALGGLDSLRAVKIYLRKASHWTQIRELAAQRVGPVPQMVVAGDLCRPELLLEIEAVAAVSGQ